MGVGARVGMSAEVDVAINKRLVACGWASIRQQQHAHMVSSLLRFTPTATALSYLWRNEMGLLGWVKLLLPSIKRHLNHIPTHFRHTRTFTSPTPCPLTSLQWALAYQYMWWAFNTTRGVQWAFSSPLTPTWRVPCVCHFGAERFCALQCCAAFGAMV